MLTSHHLQARHVNKHKAKYNIDKIVLYGGSGGGNLTIATAMKLKQEGDTFIAACVAFIPFISGMIIVHNSSCVLILFSKNILGAYNPKTTAAYPSLVENPYFIPREVSCIMSLL